MEMVAADALEHAEVILTCPPEGGEVLHLKVRTEKSGGPAALDRLYARLPVLPGSKEWSDFELIYTGDVGGWEEHVMQLDVGAQDIDLPRLKSWGAAFSGVIEAEPAPRRVWLQPWEKNIPLEPPVAVDRLGLAWRSALRVVEMDEDGERVHRLDDGEVHQISATDLEAGRDLRVELDVYAPGTSTRGGLAPRSKQRAVRGLELRVEGSFIRRGGASLHYGGQSGPWDNNFRLFWQLSGAENKRGARSKSGLYRLAFTAGDRVIGALNIEWDNDLLRGRLG